MRFGVLLCAHVDDDLLEEYGDYDRMYRDMLRKVDPSVEVVAYDAIGGELPSSPDECDGWIISGSGFSAYDDEPWIEALRAFVRDIHAHRARLLGVCFGHQIVAEALGGEVCPSSKFRLGPGTYQLDATDWWDGGEVSIPAFHGDVVVMPPPEAEVIGRTEGIDVGAMRIGDHILTIQNHPEYQPHYFDVLIDRRGQGLPDDLKADARERLGSMAHDDAVVSEWAMSFFHRDA